MPLNALPPTSLSPLPQSFSRPPLFGTAQRQPDVFFSASTRSARLTTLPALATVLTLLLAGCAGKDKDTSAEPVDNDPDVYYSDWNAETPLTEEDYKKQGKKADSPAPAQGKKKHENPPAPVKEITGEWSGSDAGLTFTPTAEGFEVSGEASGYSNNFLSAVAEGDGAWRLSGRWDGDGNKTIMITPEGNRYLVQGSFSSYSHQLYLTPHGDGFTVEGNWNGYDTYLSVTRDPDGGFVLEGDWNGYDTYASKTPMDGGFELQGDWNGYDSYVSGATGKLPIRNDLIDLLTLILMDSPEEE